MNTEHFQPGIILHEVVVGCFKASGVSLHQWCKENEISQAAAYGALKGANTGERGTALLQQLIDAAGRHVVKTAYRARIERHAAEVAA
ncbi:hypothetical protein [Phaeobacter piscinae]|uniref:hypothetical protein n=1 Tax=Phaeobacter piscinae TaxID=1580596 RepID=UPI0005916083|nr:hypothetical protein [Phaeobacter piscinae]UTS79535.1 hypothetical protein OL67_000582 [Phaeobacter piscinae]